MNNQKEKPIEMEDLVQPERNNFGSYFTQMDGCYRSSSILHTRLFTHSERIHVADRRPNTRISTHN